MSGDLRTEIEKALESSDILVLSGGVSVGKYDLVEQVLHDLGTEIFSTPSRFVPASLRFSGCAAANPSSGCQEIPFRRW